MLNLQDLSSQSGIEPVPPALGAWSLNHWTTREVPSHTFFFTYVSPVGLLIELLYFVPLFCSYDVVVLIAWHLTLW